MKTLKLKYRKLLRTIFGCVSFTAVAFVFQACYGTGPDDFYDIKLTGTVRSKSTNLPIKGIKVLVGVHAYSERYTFGMTNENGEFDFYASVPSRDIYDYRDTSNIAISTPDSVRVHFLDIDSTENGWFADKTIIINPAYKNEVKIHVELDEK